MNKQKKYAGPGPGLPWRCLLLAFLASTISLPIAAMVGWQRGATEMTQVLFAGFGVFAVLVAHLLPAELRAATPVPRLAGAVLWVICVAVAAYGHTAFFIEAQTLSGQRRVAAVDEAASLDQLAATRPVSTVLDEQAKIKTEQMRLAYADCGERCNWVRLRQVALKGHLAALDAEVEEARRQQIIQDRLEERRAVASVDPVLGRVARVLGLTSDAGSLVSGLLFAVVLDGGGGLCWFLYFQRRSSAQSQPVTLEVTNGKEHDSLATFSITSTVTEALGQAPVDVTSEDPVVSKIEGLANLVRSGIEAGQVKGTVEAIRKFLSCGQKTASCVRQALVESGVLSPGNTKPK